MFKYFILIVIAITNIGHSYNCVGSNTTGTGTGTGHSPNGCFSRGNCYIISPFTFSGSCDTKGFCCNGTTPSEKLPETCYQCTTDAPTKTPTITPTAKPTTIVTPTSTPVTSPTPGTPTSAPETSPTPGTPTGSPVTSPTLGTPTSAPATLSVNPISAPQSIAATQHPTTFTDSVIYKCNNPVAAPTLSDPLEQAYGLVHHYLQNTTLDEFALSSANKSFTDSVHCITNGVYSVHLQVNITSMLSTSYDINPARKLAAPMVELVSETAIATARTQQVKRAQWESESTTQTSASGVEVRYKFTFSFPAPSGNGGLLGSAANLNMYQYFGQLKGLIINNTLNGEFDIALDHVYSSNSFPTTYSFPQPLVFGPYYISPAVSVPSTAITAALSSAGASGMSGKLGLIIGVVVGLLCIAMSLLLAFMLYRQRKRDREQEMEQWAMGDNNADIYIFKETSAKSNTEGANPGLMSLPRALASSVITTVRNSLRRRSTRMNPPCSDNPLHNLESASGPSTDNHRDHNNDKIDAAFEYNPRASTRFSTMHRTSIPKATTAPTTVAGAGGGGSGAAYGSQDTDLAPNQMRYNY